MKATWFRFRRASARSDVIYVGCGSMVNLMALWREHPNVRTAHERGIGAGPLAEDLAADLLGDLSRLLVHPLT